MAKLSENFTLEELTASQTAARRGINNTPTGAVLAALTNTAKQMESVRALLNAPIHVSSGYRSLALNKAIGGSSTSAHCRGEAVDFTAPSFGTPREVARAIASSGIEFDQLIFEGAWVHISFTDRRPMRKQKLTATFSGKGTTYGVGIA